MGCAGHHSSSGVQDASLRLGELTIADTVDDDAEIASMCASDTGPLAVCIILNDGRALFLQGAGELVKLEAASIKLLHEAASDLYGGASTAALCGRRQLAAIGLRDGAVRIHSYEFVDDPVELLSLRPWGYDAIDTGCVSCLAFSPEAASIAIGFQHRGAAAFGLSGALEAHWPVYSGGLALSGSGLANGTVAIAWEPGNAYLLAAPATAEGARDQLGADCCVWRLGVLREPHVPGSIQPAGAAAILLLGDDHIRIAPTLPATGDQRRWRLLSVPRSYLQRAWPLRLAALTDGGDTIAVAGVRGVAIAPLSTERWRFLGASIAQLTPFRAHMIHWLSGGALLVIASHLPSSDARSVALAPLTSADGDDLQATGDLPPLSIIVLRSDLREVLFRSQLGDSSPRAPLWGCGLLPTAAPASSLGTRYGLPEQVTLVLGSAWSLTTVTLSISAVTAAGAAAPLRFQLSVRPPLQLPPDLSSSPAGLSAVLRVAMETTQNTSSDIPGLAGDRKDDGATHSPVQEVEVIVPLQDGSMVAATLPLQIEPFDARASGYIDSMESHEAIATLTAQASIWLLLPRKSAQRSWHAPGIVWTLNANGMRQWRVCKNQALAETTALQIMPQPREVLPLAVLPELCAVLGIAFLPVPAATAPLGPHVHLQPCLHHHIRRQLQQGNDATALQLARDAPFRRRYCLELLLHETLLAAAKVSPSSDARDEAAIFGSVVSLLQSLDTAEYHNVVANCARKTDAVYWDRLFAVCGSPLKLLTAAFDAGELRCAAVLLLPVRHAAGLEACDEATRRVRGRANELGMAALVRQLDAFSTRASTVLDGST